MSQLSRLLYLIHQEHVVSQEPIDQCPPGKFLRVTVIPTPGPRALVLIILVLFVVYGACFALATWQLGGRPWSDPVLPTVLVTLNGAARACFKIRERRAALVKWHEPVGREIRWVRIAFGLAGLLIAGSAGMLLSHRLPGLPTIEAKLLAAAGLGVLEGVRNVVRIGGRYTEQPNLRVEDFQVLTRLGDA